MVTLSSILSWKNRHNLQNGLFFFFCAEMQFFPVFCLFGSPPSPAGGVRRGMKRVREQLLIERTLSKKTSVVWGWGPRAPNVPYSLFREATRVDTTTKSEEVLRLCLFRERRCGALP